MDFDGTLADTVEWMAGTLNILARRHGFRELSTAEMRSLRGRTNHEIISDLEVPAWRLPLILRDGRSLARAGKDSIRLFPGVPEAIAALHDAGVSLCVCSSNAEDTVRHALRGQSGKFTEYACGAPLFGKQRKLRAVLRRSGVTPSRAIMLGDESRDIDAAHGVGIASAAAAWGYATPELLLSGRPEFLVHDIASFVRLVCGEEGASCGRVLRPAEAQASAWRGSSIRGKNLSSRLV
ncbi:HAD hydrolase-like protein [Sphingomonas sp.]|jgi:phosphoglycolate phosphatase|uniref:HAD hydrolase-like protein n=1 Tax=Sphingomonas sp. TaxID=28214 RepID=UPI002DEB609D|nr:HAD hydrolase-like protein [Sphingomonas sp.]